MIDWVTFIAPLEHQAGLGGPFYAGEVLATVPDPEQGERIEWMVFKRKAVVGSHSATIQVQSTNIEGRPAVWVSGNPAKWFQGHNIVGSDDLAGLVLEMLTRICASLGVVPSVADLECWHAGAVKLTRVDVTYSYQLRTVERVRAALRALDSTANLKHRGRGHFYGDSITFGKGSRRYSITLYAKGPELKVHPLPLDLAETSLPALADGLLRAEIRLQSMQLVKTGLDQLARWGENSPSELHHAMMAALQIADTTMLDAAHIEGLPPRLRSAYQLWHDGHDLRALYARRTFYRYRAHLLKHGIDIAITREREVQAPSNVVHLAQLLHAEPFHTPHWLHGTPWLFEPRAIAA